MLVTQRIGSCVLALSRGGRRQSSRRHGSKIWTSYAEHADYRELLVPTEPEPEPEAERHPA